MGLLTLGRGQQAAVTPQAPADKCQCPLGRIQPFRPVQISGGDDQAANHQRIPGRENFVVQARRNSLPPRREQFIPGGDQALFNVRFSRGKFFGEGGNVTVDEQVPVAVKIRFPVQAETPHEERAVRFIQVTADFIRIPDIIPAFFAFAVGVKR